MKFTKLLAAFLALCLMVTLFVACDSGDTSTQVNDGNYEEQIEKETEKQTEKETESRITIGQQNALKKAESYLKYSDFSKQGLINQLEFEGFEENDIIFAVNNVKVDWKEECYGKAKSYLKYSAFSKQSLSDQLEFEGFTADEIAYAIEKVGY